MGWAKYYEDNMDIYMGRMEEREATHFRYSEDFQYRSYIKQPVKPENSVDSLRARMSVRCN